MNSNVGEKDKVFRLIIGTLLLTLAATGQIQTIGWITGFLLIASGAIGVCVFYAAVGINTCNIKAYISENKVNKIN
jgi:hypothetical protein